MSTQPTKTTPLKEAVTELANTVSSGLPPSNEQFNKVLDETSTLIETKKKEAPLDSKGKLIAREIQEVTDAAKNFIAEKNADEAIQRFALEAQEASKEVKAKAEHTLEKGKEIAQSEANKRNLDTRAAKNELSTVAAMQLDEVKADVKAGVNTAIDIAREMISSREFRDILLQLVYSLQWIIRKSSGGLQESLDTLDQKLDEVGVELQGDKPVDEIAKDVTKEATAKATEKIEQGKTAVKEKIPAAESIAQQFTETAQQVANAVKEGTLVPLTDDQRRQVRERFDLLLSRLGQNENYKRAVTSLFNLMDQYWSFLTNTIKGTAEEASREFSQNTPHSREMMLEAKGFIERFTGKRNLDVWSNDVYNVFQLVKNDPELKAWWYEMKDYITDAINHPDQAITNERIAKFNSLIDRARDYTNRIQYDENIRRILKESEMLMHEIRQDPALNRLINSIRALAKTLLLDRKGNPTLKPDELRQLKILITSLLLEEFKYIPLPRMSGSTDKYDFLLQNINLYVFDMIPEHIHIKWETNVGVDTKNVETDTFKSNLTIRVTNLKTHMKRVRFWVRRRGVLSFEDSGFANITMGGEGAVLEVQLEANQKNPNGLGVKSCTCKIDELHFYVIDSRYDWVLNFLRPFIQGSIKREIQNAVEARLKKMMEYLFSNLHDVVEQVLPDSQRFSEVKEIVRENIKDVQKTKNALDVGHTSTTTY